MFQELPDHRLWLVKQRHAELIHEADQYRLARAHTDEPGDHLSTRLFNRIRVDLEQGFVSVRRTLSAYEPPCDDTCPEGAPC
ncbi:MAG: hypothetical protein ABSA21_13680 [Candidatus Limnocylindrales bacterium]|jgi:hypothetical protein